ncbi:MAG TPA: alpha/beta fold hydrolase [Stellaceae bacterium]|nr:alpha/beta fold hydrolase [Stellaceae bacterium]
MATFVLIHGSYQGGWIWKPVAERLRAAGHAVHAPTLDGCGERAGQVRPGITTESQAEEVAQLLFYEDLDRVVLAGTSSGGMVACRVAELAPERIARLVFVDALALLPGEKIGDIVTRSTAAGAPGGLTRGPSREDAANRLFADLDPAMKEWALARYTQHPAAIYTEGVKLDRFWSMPWRASVVWCKRAQNPGEAHQRRTAEKLKAPFLELDTGHYPMLSMPAELTAMILEG